MSKRKSYETDHSTDHSPEVPESVIAQDLPKDDIDAAHEEALTEAKLRDQAHGKLPSDQLQADRATGSFQPDYTGEAVWADADGQPKRGTVEEYEAAIAAGQVRSTGADPEQPASRETADVPSASSTISHTEALQRYGSVSATLDAGWHELGNGAGYGRGDANTYPSEHVLRGEVSGNDQNVADHSAANAAIALANTPGAQDDGPLGARKLAEIAYNAYGAATGGLSHTNLPMPAWHGLPPATQAAWVAAALAITDRK